MYENMKAFPYSNFPGWYVPIEWLVFIFTFYVPTLMEINICGFTRRRKKNSRNDFSSFFPGTSDLRFKGSKTLNSRVTFNGVSLLFLLLSRFLLQVPKHSVKKLSKQSQKKIQKSTNSVPGPRVLPKRERGSKKCLKRNLSSTIFLCTPRDF